MVTFELPEKVIKQLEEIEPKIQHLRKSGWDKMDQIDKLWRQISTGYIFLYNWYFLWILSDGTYQLTYTEDEGSYAWSSSVPWDPAKTDFGRGYNHLAENMNAVAEYYFNKRFLPEADILEGSFMTLLKEGNTFTWDTSHVFIKKDSAEYIAYVFQKEGEFKIIFSIEEPTLQNYVLIHQEAVDLALVPYSISDL